MELELRRLEDLAESIVNDFAQMKLREETHRDTNGDLTLWFCLLLVILCALCRTQDACCMANI